MAYTFGAATSDDISGMTTARVANSDNGQNLLWGWFYPTTLTAGRGLWSFGNTYGCRIAAATDELQMDSDNTTDGMWETTDADITVDKWWFIAWMSCFENTTVAGDWRVWVGDVDNPPVSKTIVNTTPRSGNYTQSQAFTIGNRGTGTVAFQGHIGNVNTVLTNGGPGIMAWHNSAVSGVISATEEVFIYERWVQPAWLGRPNTALIKAIGMVSPFAGFSVDLNRETPRWYQYSDTTSNDFQGNCTVNGATFSELRTPIITNPKWLFEMPFTPSRR